MKQIQSRADKVEYEHAYADRRATKHAHIDSRHGGARKERARKGTASAGKETAVVRKGKEQCERSFEKGRNSVSGRSKREGTVRA
eukprot:756966-Prorocentrum_minimum.AAC.1